MQPLLEQRTVSTSVEGVELDIATMYRAGDLTPIVFLHGFGSTKEDYADIVHYSAFDGHPVLAYDAPGCGKTLCSDLSRVSIPFLVETAGAILDRFGIDRFHLVGHSMGGLTALMLAHANPERMLSFTDIEGNVAPEDCFLSRQVIDYPADSDQAFFDAFIERIWHSPYFSCPLYAASLRHKVRAQAVRGIFTSMVELSDHADLMTKFLSLPCLRMFMYGEQNASLSYLGHLRDNGVALAEIKHAGHFPMYSNPVEMWGRLAQFLADAGMNADMPG
ncbi:alpha/beta fold hydrolase [Trinickia dinghuensis]|uniref:Alpha/beta hydrolase n=1 Tax=Trinickia dinghuensis TaxID=2291023 RepID=A0A3D8JXY4_9BURK|nr:alpha/beta hydrolase [Trinickia dinghuensis]RDU97672.1 alpha/beta hydrolase [Trinickia dinghuensis]